MPILIVVISCRHILSIIRLSWYQEERTIVKATLEVLLLHLLLLPLVLLILSTLVDVVIMSRSCRGHV
jgi:hypothetical protein